MAVVPEPPTFEVGESDTTELNQLRDAVRFCQDPPIFRAHSNTTQTLTTGVSAAVLLQSEDWDSEDGHSTSSNTSRYTAVYAGYYAVDGVVFFAGNATGRRGVSFSVNGTNQHASRTLVFSGGASGIQILGVDEVYLAVGDYVEMFAFQESGGNLNIGSAIANDNSRLNVRWVRKSV
jgi:hypothetical protein